MNELEDRRFESARPKPVEVVDPEDARVSTAIGNLFVLILVARRNGKLRELVVRLGDAAAAALELD